MKLTGSGNNLLFCIGCVNTPIEMNDINLN